jgi:membrane fusion protein, multidrug efflux system
MKCPYPSLLLGACVIFVFTGCQKQEARNLPASAAGPPAVPVSVVQASREAVPTELRIVGTVEASAVVQVKSQIAGPLDRVAFAEGQNVNKGDLLFVIDPRPFQEAVRQADAAVNRDRALIEQGQAGLARDTAQARFAESEAGRYAELQKAGAVSRSQSDQSRTNAEATRESARATQAAIESAKAALEADAAAAANARLNLSYTEIKAPISGRTGNLLVHAGNLVKVNDVPLVVIHQLAPAFVNFSVPEQHLASIRRLSAGGRLTVNVFAQDNPARAATGYLAVIDNAVDTATGTIRLKATFPNADGALWPGQFVTAVLTLETIPNAILVPTEAVQSGQRGQFVYVVKPDSTVESRPVTVGRAFGKRMVVTSGLAAGESVVTDGQMRLAPGARVRVVPAVGGAL